MDDLSDYADEWAETLHGVSEQTKIVYQRSIRQFRMWLADEHPDVLQPGQITHRHVNNWLSKLKRDGRADSTRRVRLIALRLWLEYMTTEPDNDLKANPARQVDLPTVTVQPVPVVDDRDLTALLRVTAGSSFLDRRDHAALRILIDTGCRRGELVGIDVNDVDLHAHEIVLRRTKGGRARTVPIGSKTTLAIRRYLRSRNQKTAAASTAALFLASRPNESGDWRMKGNGVGDMLVRRCGAAGIKQFTPHRLRHTWASDMLAHGAAEGDVEKLAGWRSPLMIRRYSASTAEQRARDAAKRLRRGDRV